LTGLVGHLRSALGSAAAPVEDAPLLEAARRVKLAPSEAPETSVRVPTLEGGVEELAVSRDTFEELCAPLR
jgi:molecular chaperone DnaK (HSP70)